jgi:ribose transport system permease protein
MTGTMTRDGQYGAVARSAWSYLMPPGLAKFSAVYLWALFIVVFGILQFHSFLAVSTFQLVFSQGAVTAVLAVAFLIPLTTETYDLSVGETMSLSIVVMCWSSTHIHIPLILIAVCVILFSAFIGAVNGFVVVRLRVNSLIATLGMLEVLNAAQLYVSQNQQVAGKFSTAASGFGNGTAFGIPYLDLCLVGIGIIVWFLLEQTQTGRRMYATGGNREAARLAGIRTDRIVWSSLATSGAISGFAGVLYAVQVGSYTGDVGQSYLFPALAAVFFGASILSRRPNLWGTLIAYFALAFGIEGLTLEFGGGAFWISPLFQGAALILAVAVASSRGTIGNAGDGRVLRRAMSRWKPDREFQPANAEIHAPIDKPRQLHSR